MDQDVFLAGRKLGRYPIKKFKSMKERFCTPLFFFPSFLWDVHKTSNKIIIVFSLERFLHEFGNTNVKLITYQLDYSVNLKP